MRRLLGCTVLAFILLGTAGHVGAAEPSPPVAMRSAQQIILEATRQDMVEYRLMELIGRFEYLAADLKANGVVGTDAQGAVARLAERLRDVKETSLAEAQARLRKAVSEPAEAAEHLAAAERRIDVVARELGSLLLQAGLSRAVEVFAAEVKDLIARQEDLRQATLDANGAAADDLAVRQERIAERLDALIEELAALDRADGDPLAAIRVSQVRKTITGRDVGGRLRQSAEKAYDGLFAEAAAGQAAALVVLREAEARLRPSARLEALLRARDLLESAAARQKDLRFEVAGMSQEQFAERRDALAAGQHAVLRRLRRLDASIGVKEPLAAANRAGTEVLAATTAGNRDRAATAQQAVQQALADALDAVAGKIAELQKLDVAYQRLRQAAGRLKAVEDLEERQAELLDKAAERAFEKQSVSELSRPQDWLKAETEQFAKALPAEDRWTSLLRKPLEQAAGQMATAQQGLEANRFDDRADPAMNEALESLAEAVDVAQKAVDYLEQIWSLMQLAGDLRQVAVHLDELRAEQEDVLDEVQASDPAAQDAVQLARSQQLLLQALDQTKEMGDLIPEAASMVPLLTQSRASMAAAVEHLGEGRTAPATAMQKRAAEQLAQLHGETLALAERAEYMSEWLASMEQSTIDAVDLLQRQIALRRQTEPAVPDQFEFLAGEQEILHGEASVYAEIMFVGNKHYRDAARAMAAAIGALRAPDREQAVAHQIEAEEALRRAAEALFQFLEALRELWNAQDDPTAMERFPDLDLLTRLLLLAVEQRELRTKTHVWPEADLGRFVPEQEELRRCASGVLAGDVFAALPEAADHVRAAVGEMHEAVVALKQPERNEAVRRQQLAEKRLRMAFAEVLVYAYSLLLPRPPGDVPDNLSPAQTQTVGLPVTAGGMEWNLFLKMMPKGEAVERRESEWEPLSDRERGALNENFARELPVEYRDLLKRYYEMLSK